MNNRGVCIAKIDKKHNQNDIEYFGDWIAHFNVIKFNAKDKYLESLNNDLQLIKNEIKEYNFQEAGQKLQKFFWNGRY
jgi:valyl-tRNA synthetase